MTTITQYKTKPIDCWPRMKELRRMHFHHTWEAQAKGEVVVLGIVETFLSLFAGLGNFANPSYGPYFTVMMRNPAELVKCLEAVEARGFTRDLCSSMRCHLGQMYRGLTTRSPKGGTVRPDFILQTNECHSMIKTGQIFSEYLGVPYFVLDFPHRLIPNLTGYLLPQMQEAIAWMEKVSGKKYDDEKLIEAVHNEWECSVLWSRLCERNKAIPAPLDMRQMWSLRLPMVTMRHKKEAVEFYRTLSAEVEDRVRDQISARGFERARLLHEGIPPFYSINLLRQPAEYGALFVGGEILFTSFGAWAVFEDSTWQAAPPLGRRLRTREEALLALIDLYLVYRPHFCYPRAKPEEYVKRAQDWHCDGVVLHLDRGCKGYQSAMLERKLALQERGIPTTTYEGSQADCRDFSEAQTRDRLESFLESLGLTKLAQEESKEGAEEE